MSIPDKLVEAAAAALHERWKKEGCAHVGKWHQCTVDAKTALAAAFAALPECEEAVDAIATALVAAWDKQPYVGQTAMKDAETAAAALAEMAKP